MEKKRDESENVRLGLDRSAEVDDPIVKRRIQHDWRCRDRLKAKFHPLSTNEFDLEDFRRLKDNRIELFLQRSTFDLESGRAFRCSTHRLKIL